MLKLALYMAHKGAVYKWNICSWKVHYLRHNSWYL